MRPGPSSETPGISISPDCRAAPENEGAIHETSTFSDFPKMQQKSTTLFINPGKRAGIYHARHFSEGSKS